MFNSESTPDTFSKYMTSLVNTKNQNKVLYGKPSKFTDLLTMTDNESDWWFTVLYNYQGFRVIATNYLGDAYLLFSWNNKSLTQIKKL